MSDIFISYDHADRERAMQLATALEAEGWSVWWDRQIRLGKRFHRVIQRELDAAVCVLVLWSEQALDSDYVRDEANEAQKRGALVSVLILGLAWSALAR